MKVFTQKNLLIEFLSNQKKDIQIGNQKILCSKNKFIKLKYKYHKEKIKFDTKVKFNSDLFILPEQN